MTDAQFLERMTLLGRLGYLALAGSGVLILSMLWHPADAPFSGGLFVLGILAVVPVVFYFVLVCIWHWKSRYRGEHSDLWGGMLLLETSGWSKLIYLFRHLLPDLKGEGRYRRSIAAPAG